MPSARINGLSGTHTIPPDIAVEPPTRACFSSTSAEAPASATRNAPTSPPPPLPTLTKSYEQSHRDIAVSERCLRTRPARRAVVSGTGVLRRGHRRAPHADEHIHQTAGHFFPGDRLGGHSLGQCPLAFGTHLHDDVARDPRPFLQDPLGQVRQVLAQAAHDARDRV